MSNKFLLIAGLSITFASPLCFGWGLPTLPSLPGLGSIFPGNTLASISTPPSTSASASAPIDVDKFLAEGKDSSKLINASRDRLVEAISTKEERASRQSTLDQINSRINAGDKKADEQLTQFHSEENAKLLAAVNDKAEQDRLANLSSKQKQAVAIAFVNFAFGVMLQTKQIQTGQSLLSSFAGGLSILSKLPEVKDSLSDMLNNAKTGGELVLKLPALFKSADIKFELPKDTTSKPTPLENFPEES